MIDIADVLKEAGKIAWTKSNDSQGAEDAKFSATSYRESFVDWKTNLNPSIKAMIFKDGLGRTLPAWALMVPAFVIVTIMLYTIDKIEHSGSTGFLIIIIVVSFFLLFLTHSPSGLMKKSVKYHEVDRMRGYLHDKNLTADECSLLVEKLRHQEIRHLAYRSKLSLVSSMLWSGVIVCAWLVSLFVASYYDGDESLLVFFDYLTLIMMGLFLTTLVIFSLLLLYGCFVDRIYAIAISGVEECQKELLSGEALGTGKTTKKLFSVQVGQRRIEVKVSRSDLE